MKSPVATRHRPGILKVSQMQGEHEIRRDFDAEEWSHVWVKRGGVDVLQLLHDGDPEATDSFDFVEFSAPVTIAFEYED